MINIHILSQLEFLNMNLEELKHAFLKRSAYYYHILYNSFNNGPDKVWDKTMIRDRVLRYK